MTNEAKNSDKKVKTIAIIPARGGSKGVPRKNLRPFNGKPLIAHSIEYALSARSVDRVYVSTEDVEIAAAAHQFGADVIPRPQELAGDSATTESAIKHGLDWLASEKNIKPETIVLLQATSPMRPSGSLELALEKFHAGGFDSLLTISPTHRFFWRTKGEIAVAEYDFLNRPRRQDIQPEDIRFMENGSVYIFTQQHFEKTGNRLGGKIGYYVFDEKYAVEIDRLTDFLMLEMLAKTQGEDL